MTITFDRVGTCPNPVSMLVECYSPRDGRAHGSLDVTVRTCESCHQTVRTQVDACGMTPYSFTPVATHHDQGGTVRVTLCGDRMIFGPNRYTDTRQ